MKCGIVMSSELFKHNRMDADFHLINKEYAELANILSVTMLKNDVIRLLSDKDLISIEVLLLVPPWFVAGVAYFDGDTISIPVDTSPTYYVADCWVIELADWTGPSMIDNLVSDGNVPVPRRHEDLGKPVGFVENLADHTVNYGVGWRA